jgi:hypothetical protein
MREARRMDELRTFGRRGPDAAETAGAAAEARGPLGQGPRSWSLEESGYVLPHPTTSVAPPLALRAIGRAGRVPTPGRLMHEPEPLSPREPAAGRRKAMLAGSPRNLPGSAGRPQARHSRGSGG